MSLIIDFFFDFLFYRTGRLAIRALTLGRVEVERFLAIEGAFWWGYKRRENGTIVIGATIASLVGLLVWGVLLVWLIRLP